MKLSSRIATVSLAGVLAVAGTFALAQSPQEPPADMPFDLPEGWTMEDMMACVEAATPGEMHAHLAKGIGVWDGKTKMWMGPDSSPMESTCVSTISSMMDGRYVKAEIEGEMPGMGPFNGFGVYGYDNVAETFVSTWVDNHSTGIMNGTGELSEDGKTMTWTFNYNCPVTKKPAVMREVERITGDNSMVLEMFGTDPKSGEEYKMMEIAFTRRGEEAMSDAR